MGINKDTFQLSAEYHFGGSNANFPIGPMTPEHAGTYTCYGSYKHTPYEWSESSDPVDIKITGLYKKPSLSALMGTVETSGENMILTCTSDYQFDMFHLSMKGLPLGHGLPAEQSHSGTFQANFLPVPLIQTETYRCYGSFRNPSHVWSSPSDPLYLSVSVNSSRNFTSSTEPDSKTDNHRTMNILIGLSVTMMSVFLTILLYSCCSAKKSKSQEQAQFPIPTISAATSPVVPWNGSVRILCQGIPEAFLYQLSLMKNSTHTVIEKKLGFQKEAEFIINHMNTTTAGCYQCQYRIKDHWSEYSKPLELVVTGLYNEPVLSTDQSRVLIAGESISFQCSSAHDLFNRFSLVKEGDASLPQHQHEGYQGKFTLGPVNPNFAGNYSCYCWHNSSPYVWSAPSNALELIVTDSKKQGYMIENSVRMSMAGLVLVVLLPLDSVHTQVSIGLASGMLRILTALLGLESLQKPIIWAEPSTRVTNGNAVTIWCKGHHTATHYQLYFEGSFSALERPKPSRATNKVNFTIPQMTSHTAGKYTCCYQSGERQSKSSKGLNLIVTGECLYDTPNLWVHPGPEVTLGENVTFFCHLDSGTSKFFLLKEGRSNHIQHRLGTIKAEFPMGPMTRAHRGTYRCFGSYNDYVWSFPSKPVTLLIPVQAKSVCGLSILCELASTYDLIFCSLLWVTDADSLDMQCFVYNMYIFCFARLWLCYLDLT
ncbi:Natural cytotoxicity triggering receptor 1 [Microtus ochrogaster]|uniref:Natural cytotoxicity triggering receptor 1 n=1 Tax=Microtus ochrogaster TaxID=79684 RepID=A0A8J6G9Y2_MICOH|nr:Natural cytotoxicity triggering receptor 1 [Microtus ochrogaster]